MLKLPELFKVSVNLIDYSLNLSYKRFFVNKEIKATKLIFFNTLVEGWENFKTDKNIIHHTPVMNRNLGHHRALCILWLCVSLMSVVYSPCSF